MKNSNTLIRITELKSDTPTGVPNRYRPYEFIVSDFQLTCWAPEGGHLGANGTVMSITGRIVGDSEDPDVVSIVLLRLVSWKSRQSVAELTIVSHNSTQVTSHATPVGWMSGNKGEFVLDCSFIHPVDVPEIPPESEGSHPAKSRYLAKRGRGIIHKPDRHT